MSEEMRAIHIRIDKDFYEIISRKAKERGIKLSRYIRMLMERGLVIDHQYHNAGKDILNAATSDSSLPVIAELCAETTMMVRYIYRENFDNDEAYRDMVNKIYHQSQQLLEMMKRSQENKE